MDPDTYAKLCEEHHAWVRRYFEHNLHDGHQAEDLTQQVFDQLSRGPAPENPRAYIGAIARNLLARHLREKQKELARLRRLLDTIRKGDFADHPGDTSAPSECEDILNDIATSLPAESMELLKMRFFEDLSPREMAARLGCSEQAIHKEAPAGPQVPAPEVFRG